MTEFGRYLKQCPPALKDKTRTLSLLKDALKNDLPKFRVLQAAYELGILEAIQRSNPISTDDRLKITTGLVSQYAMLENAAKNAIDYWQDSVDADILYRALNDADECRESRINSAESTARPAIPIKPQQNPAENLLKIESISQDSIRMGIRLQWEKQSEIECYEIWRAKESEQPVKIKEGSRERIQIFEGTVIAKKHGGLEETFTVRRVSYGVGVEKVFPVHAPSIEKIETVRHGKVRRAKLYYLRDRVGKSAKIKEAL